MFGLVPIAVGIVLAVMAPRADILISGYDGIIAVRGADGLMSLSSVRREKFIRQEWMEREGLESVRTWPESGAQPEDFLNCDTKACRYRWQDQAVSFVFAPDIFFEECAEAKIMIAPVVALPKDLSNCRKKILIMDRWDLKRSGAVAVYFNQNDVIIRTVADERGQRPWTGFSFSKNPEYRK